jgi:hypothetical protein
MTQYPRKLIDVGSVIVDMVRKSPNSTLLVQIVEQGLVPVARGGLSEHGGNPCQQRILFH